MLQTWMAVVAMTAAVLPLLGAVATKGTTRKFSSVLMGPRDLEEVSSAAIQGLISDALRDRNGRWSLGRAFTLFLIVTGAVYLLIRLLSPTAAFLPDGVAGDAAFSAAGAFAVIAFLSFLIGLIIGFGFMMLIQRVSDPLQIALGLGLLALHHGVFSNLLWAGGRMNIGLEALAHTPHHYGLPSYVEPIAHLGSSQSGVQHLMLAAYIAAFVIPAVFWLQVAIGQFARPIIGPRAKRDDGTPRNPKPNAAQRCVRFLFGPWANAEKHPFVTATIILVILESAAFGAVWLARTTLPVLNAPT